MSQFKVGQKVVCVGNKGWKFELQPVKGPSENDVVTIKSIDNSGYLQFEEYQEPINGIPRRLFPYFNPKHFRPLNERRDVDVTELVRKFSVKETLDAPYKIPEEIKES